MFITFFFYFFFYFTFFTLALHFVNNKGGALCVCNTEYIFYYFKTNYELKLAFLPVYPFQNEYKLHHHCLSFLDKINDTKAGKQDNY